MPKFLKTIRFDKSDLNVFQKAAQEGEWAISGVFPYFDQAPNEISGKHKQAFANGFLGLATYGRSTFASVTNILDDELTHLETALASSMLEQFGAPDEDSAMRAAKEELAFICDLCEEPPPNTVFAVRRSFKDDGRINETFHMVQAKKDRDDTDKRIWRISTDDT